MASKCPANFGHVSHIFFDSCNWWWMKNSQTLEEQTRFSAFGHQSPRFVALQLPDKGRLLEYGWDARKKHKWKHSQKCEKPGLPLPQFQFWQYQILFLKIFMISGIPIDISFTFKKKWMYLFWTPRKPTNWWSCDQPRLLTPIAWMVSSAKMYSKGVHLKPIGAIRMLFKTRAALF